MTQDKGQVKVQTVTVSCIFLVVSICLFAYLHNFFPFASLRTEHFLLDKRLKHRNKSQPSSPAMSPLLALQAAHRPASQRPQRAAVPGVVNTVALCAANAEVTEASLRGLQSRHDEGLLFSSSTFNSTEGGPSSHLLRH